MENYDLAIDTKEWLCGGHYVDDPTLKRLLSFIVDAHVLFVGVFSITLFFYMFYLLYKSSNRDWTKN